MARPLSDIDPRKLNVSDKPKHRRKDRKKPDPSPQQKAAEPGANEAVEQLPMSPGVMAEYREGAWHITAPHNDQSLWELQLAQAFGTRSHSLLKTFTSQLKALAPEAWDEDLGVWKSNETEWNALLALVSEQRPENSTQAALAAQMAATHLMTMRLMAQASNYGHVTAGDDLALANRLARTFTMQCEAMQTLKGKAKTAKQSIHVTKETSQHVHYHDHRGDGENANQPHEPDEGTQTIEGCAKVPSVVQINGEALPRSSGERQVRVSQTRRGKGNGRTKG